MALWRHFWTLRHGGVTEEGCPCLGWDLSGRFIPWQGRTMDKQAMKDEVHFKIYRSYLKAGSLFSTPKKSSNGPRDERPTFAFIAGPQRPFLQLPAPVSPSSTAFNQWAKMSRLLHIGSTRSSFERKACFQSPLQILVESLFSRHERDALFSFCLPDWNAETQMRCLL